MSIDVPFEELDCCEFVRSESDGKWSINVKSDFTMWHLKQRAYFFGQKHVTRRIDIRDAIIDSASIIYADPEKGHVHDSFKIDMLRQVFHVEKPREQYKKARREFVRQQKEKNRGK